ncbi:invasion associated locus B family protein [Acetobacter fabarum]|jgi:invasion protein IalB|uniref:invasion associated locus B family protein n=1 Tax=Acetobacter fabarum TaxID=483199 RepID=UPI0039ECCF85
MKISEEITLKKSLLYKLFFTSLTSTLFVSSGYAAATTKAITSLAATSPVTLSGSVGEWTYRCVFPSDTPSVAPNICIIEQQLITQDVHKQTIPLGSVFLARSSDDPINNPLSSRPWHLTLMTPLGLSLKNNPRLIVDKTAPFTLAWQSCVTSGCLSTLDLNKDQVDALRHSHTGHIEIDKLAGGVFTINFTLEGVDVALKTLENWIYRNYNK